MTDAGRPQARPARQASGGQVGGPAVDRAPAVVDGGAIVPIRITRRGSRLWEPGDSTGTAIGPVTWVDGPSSTIHSPYCYLWF